MSSSDSDISPEIEKAEPTLIPQKSKLIYETAYKNFGEWLACENVQKIDEKVMLAYFSKKASFSKPSTMWSEYSKLRTTIYLNNSVDISKFTGLIAFLRRENKGYIAKKSETLNRKEIERFLLEASDETYLMMKAALIMGVTGGLRRDELVRLSLKNVNDLGKVLKVNVKCTKPDFRRQFFITEGSLSNCNLVFIVRKYLALRSERTPHDRFFVNYRNGKCTTQPVGINTIGAIPRKIATFLGKKNSELFTGNCFRRSSAALLAELRSDPTYVFERHESWKSTNVAENPISTSRDIVSTFSMSQGLTITDTSNETMIAGNNVSLASGNHVPLASRNNVALTSENTAQDEGIHHGFGGMRSPYQQNVDRTASNKINDSSEYDSYVPTTFDESNQNVFESNFVPSSPSQTTSFQVHKLEYLSSDENSSEFRTNQNQNEVIEEYSNFSVKTTKDDIPQQRCDSYGQHVAASLKLMSAWNQALAISEISNILLKYDPNNPNQG